MNQNPDIYQNVNIRQIAEKGNEIYESIKAKYEQDKGKFLAIDIESGDPFLDESNSGAVEAAKKKYPDHVFYVVKIGYSATERLARMATSV